jgi:hypothetical protein
MTTSSSIIVCVFVSAETFVGSLATVWFAEVYTFSFPYPWTRLLNSLRLVCVHESYLCGNMFASSFRRNAYMSEYNYSKIEKLSSSFMSTVHVRTTQMVGFDRLQYWTFNLRTACVIQWSEFLATDPDFLGSINGVTRFSKKYWVKTGVHSASWG